MCACSSSNICLQRFAGARLKQELLTLQAQLNERRQAEPVHAVVLHAGQQLACTISTAAVASEPLPAEAVPPCGDLATPLEVSAAAAAGHMTGATALLVGEPAASPMMLDGLDVVSAFRSPAPLALTAVASNGPAGPVGEDAISPTASMAGFGSPIASPSPTTAAATTDLTLQDAVRSDFGSTTPSALSTTAVANTGADSDVITAAIEASSSATAAGPPAATAAFRAPTAALSAAIVPGNESAELADPGTTLPEEPSTSLHAMAPAGPQETATPALLSDAMSPFGGSGPDPDTPHSMTMSEFCEGFLREGQCSPWTPGPAAATASSPPVSVGPVAAPGGQHASPPAGPPAVIVEAAGFGSPIATAAPTTAAAANGNDC